MSSGAGTFLLQRHKAFANEEDAERVKKNADGIEIAEENRSTHDEPDADNNGAPEYVLHVITSVADPAAIAEVLVSTE